MHTCLWNEPPQVSERVCFEEFVWKYHNFFKYKNRRVEPTNFTVSVLKRSCLGLSRNMFSGGWYIRVWDEPSQVSERVVFAQCQWKHNSFLNIKTGEWYLKILLFDYWKDLALGSLETCSWKSVHTCLWNEPPQLSERVVFAKFEWKHHNFWNIKTSEWDLQILLFKYWKDLVLGTVETYFLGVGAYVSLKRAPTGVWEGSFWRI